MRKSEPKITPTKVQNKFQVKILKLKKITKFGLE
jgi:hypothetical protein